MGQLRGVVLVAALMLPGLASAALVDAVAVTTGTDSRASTHVNMVRLSLQKHWQQRWFTQGNWYLTGYWELGFGYWHGNAGDTGRSHIEAVDFRPVLRLQRQVSSRDATQFYVEGGVGPALLSATHIDNLQFSTTFQFGSHIGAGICFGRDHRFDLEYRFMHYSNADIKKPNDGISFNVVQLGWVPSGG
ncbi:MAG: acyloxyacyl hydrolase [Gammaproteobacteria bacterium]